MVTKVDGHKYWYSRVEDVVIYELRPNVGNDSFQSIIKLLP